MSILIREKITENVKKFHILRVRLCNKTCLHYRAIESKLPPYTSTEL